MGTGFLSWWPVVPYRGHVSDCLALVFGCISFAGAVGGAGAGQTGPHWHVWWGVCEGKSMSGDEKGTLQGITLLPPKH